MKTFNLNYRLLFISILVFSVGHLFSQENDVDPKEHAKHIREQIHMMTFSPMIKDDYCPNSPTKKR